MTYKAKVTFKYDSTWDYTGSSFDDLSLPEEHITYEFPVEDANVYQIFRAFGKFMFSIGFDAKNIAKGGASIAFNSENSSKDMRDIADEFDLILSEDHGRKVIELENKIHSQEKEILDLKAKLSRFENPDNRNYTDEEIDCMSFKNRFKNQF